MIKLLVIRFHREMFYWLAPPVPNRLLLHKKMSVKLLTGNIIVCVRHHLSVKSIGWAGRARGRDINVVGSTESVGELRTNCLLLE